MVKFPVLQSPDKRVQRQITSEEELETYREMGYTQVRSNTDTTAREPLNSGAEGQQRARAASTTAGSEVNSGSTTPSTEELARAEQKKAAEAKAAAEAETTSAQQQAGSATAAKKQAAGNTAEQVAINTPPEK
jgi:hypothetical protein